jgi:tetratricopeptide (TPR) repeat protein
MDKAETTLRDAINAKPDDIDRHLLLVEFLATRKSVGAAETELLAAIKSYPEAHKLQFSLARLYGQIGAHDKVAQVYRDIIDTGGTSKDGLDARNKLAELLLKQGRRDEAEKLTEEVLKENPQDNDGLINKARLALSKGNAEAAIPGLRQVLRDQPGSVEVNTLLASAHLQMKQTELAKESLLKSVELNPRDVRAKVVLAQFLAQNRDIEGALKNINEALKLAPNDLDVLLAKMELMAAKRDTKGLQSVIASIKEKHPDRPVGYYQMGRYLASQKRYDEAVREFELALSKSRPIDAYQTLSAIVSAYLAQGKPEKSIGRLNGILKESPSHPFAHELLAEVYITGKRYSEAEKELHSAIKNNPKWNVPYRNLANLYLVRGQFPAAADIYRQGLEAIPDDTELLLHLAQAYERNRDFSKAIDSYEYVLRKHPDSEVAVNNLASLLADQRGDAASLKRAKELALRFESSSQPAFMDTLGWVYYKTGEVDKAVDLLKKVVKQAPDAPIFRYHLGMAYHKQGNLSEAKIQLAKAMESKNDFTGKDEARTTLQQIP